MVFKVDQEVSYREDAYDLALAGDGQVADAPLAHHGIGLLGGFFDIDGDDGAAHDALDEGLIGVQSFCNAPAYQVGLAQDADVIAIPYNQK